jgi:hypothetical protein
MMRRDALLKQRILLFGVGLEHAAGGDDGEQVTRGRSSGRQWCETEKARYRGGRDGSFPPRISANVC